MMFKDFGMRVSYKFKNTLNNLLHNPKDNIQNSKMTSTY